MDLPVGKPGLEGIVGTTPPVRTPVFVLTHHHRPSFTLTGTTFHFVNATPAEASLQYPNLD
ncbi:MAG: hypothetical protein NVS3B21_02960 [Acidimicrobiales bacterium]